MDISKKDITFIIVTFESEKIIDECLNSLPKESKKIIIENSQNLNLKKDLELKYDNIEVIISNNNGMGSSNNIGLKKCQSKFAYVINPDTKLRNDTIDRLIESLKEINNFAILSPINSDFNNPNYKLINENSSNLKILEVNYVDGFSMFINLDEFKTKEFFDENIFLYLENNDLCLRTIKQNKKIYVIKEAMVDHVGAGSSNDKIKNKIEHLRNWHWMWSKFYYNKKHYGIIKAYFSISTHFISALIKSVYYLISFNSHKKKIYFMRLSGIINSISGKKSWKRIET